jgi:putative lipoic acid-binding regulatory protein
MEQETNNSLLTFPGDFPIKIMGKNTTEFETTILGIIRKHFPELKEDAIQTRASKEKNYLAITVTVHAESKEPLDAVYRELSSNKLVLMAL